MGSRIMKDIFKTVKFRQMSLIFTDRVLSTTGGYVFTGVCLLTGEGRGGGMVRTPSPTLARSQKSIFNMWR